MLHPETSEVLNTLKRTIEFILTKNFNELNEKLDILLKATKPYKK